MTVNLLCFGHLTDYFGAEMRPIEVMEGATIQDLIAEMERLEPRVSPLASRCRFALNEEYTTLQARLTPDCTVAALPPMSGG